MTTQTFNAGAAADKSEYSIIARLFAWFATHNRKVLSSSWADGARGM